MNGVMFIKDKRFSVDDPKGDVKGTLRIQNVTKQDGVLYSCETAATKSLIKLNVIGKFFFI